MANQRHEKHLNFVDEVNIHEKIGCGQQVVGWIHSHVRGEKCFFSGLDLHIQFSSQKSNSNFVGVVMQISKIGQYEDHKMYKLIEMRMKVVNDCIENHKGHAPCGRLDSELYQSISSNVTLMLDLSFTPFYSQQFETVASNVRSRNSRKRKAIQLGPITQYNSKGQNNEQKSEACNESPIETCKVCDEPMKFILKH